MVDFRPICARDLPAVIEMFQRNVEEFPDDYEKFNVERAVQAFFRFPTAMGVIGLRLGKPVAYMLGEREKDYLKMWSFYIDPEVRGRKCLYAMAAAMKKAVEPWGIMHWESDSTPRVAKFLKVFFPQTQVRYERLRCEYQEG